MTKPISKQISNDGGYHIKRLVNEANARLKQIGKQGKRATIVAKKTSLSLQFTFDDGNGRKQKNVGLGAIPVSANGILEAEKIAQTVTGQLVAGTFTWDWFNSLIGKPTSEQTKQLTCKEMVEQYKSFFFKEKASNKSVKCSWLKRCGHIERTLADIDKPLSLVLIRRVISATNNNSQSRKDSLNGLVGFLKFHNNDNFKELIKEYKANNKIKRKPRKVPSEKKIVTVFKTGFHPKPTSPKKILHVYPQWQFLFGLLATYGLRIHEAWNIANWDKPATLEDGDWVTVIDLEDNEVASQYKGETKVYKSILDPGNEKHLLCIKNGTKTGFRLAMPISPVGDDWVKRFGLLQPLNLPDMLDPLGKVGKDETAYRCSHNACNWFRRAGYGFTPHDLRHAFNIRGYQQNYNPKALADSMGHSLQMGGNNYLVHMTNAVKHEGIENAVSTGHRVRSKNELLKAKNEVLKTQLEAANKEIELLQTKLKMYEAIEESKGQNR